MIDTVPVANEVHTAELAIYHLISNKREWSIIVLLKMLKKNC